LQELSDRDKIFTDICPNWNSNDSLKDEDLKKFILKTALKEMKRAYGRIQSSLAQIKDSKNSKNNGDASKKIAARRESAISTNRDIISKNIELIQSGIGALLEKNLDTNYELIPDEIDLLNNLEIGEDELKEKDEEIERLREELEAKSSTGEGAEGENAGDSSEVEKLREEMKELEEDRDQWKSLSQEIEALANQSMQEYEEQLAKSKEHEEKLEQDLLIAQKKVEQLDSILAKLTRRK